VNTIGKLGLALVILILAATQAPAGDLDGFLGEINVRARADLPLFKADLSATFGVPVPKIDGLLKVLPTPGDVYMSLRIGELCDRPIDVVVDEYRRGRGAGWGVIAKNLGIKPGSAEFHALKQGRLPDGHGSRAARGGSGHEKSGSKSKGKGKGKS